MGRLQKRHPRKGQPPLSPAASVVTTNVFDPASVQPGDTVLGLRVVSKNVEQVSEDSLWIGEVVFEGDLVVQGVYQPHPDWPQITAPCFHVTDAESVARVPALPPGRPDRRRRADLVLFC